MNRLAMVVALTCSAWALQAQKPFTLTVERNMSCKDGSTMGVLRVEGKAIAKTLELPEKGRVAAGKYAASIRADGSKGWRIELQNVPGRGNIQIHVGNYPSNSTGCILVGTKIEAATDPATKKEGCAVLSSKAALQDIADAMQAASGDGVSSQPIAITVIVKD